MRVSDMVAIQAWLDTQWESPLEALGASLSDSDDEGRRKLLLSVWDALEAGPPIFGSDRANALLDTRVGVILIIAVVLSQFHPELDGMEIVRIRDETTQEQYENLLAAWRRKDTTREVASVLGFLPDDETGSAPIGWPEVITELCGDYGWTLDYIFGLTLSQIRMIRRGGKPIEYGTPVAPKTTLKETMMARRKMLAELNGGKINA